MCHKCIYTDTVCMYIIYIYITYIYIDLVIYTYNIRYNALYNAWMGWVGACSHRDWFFSAPSRDMGQNPPFLHFVSRQALRGSETLALPRVRQN